MAQSLRVDPAVLRSAATAIAQVGSELSGMALAQPLSGMTGALAGFQCGAGCQQAGTALDNASKRVGSDLSDLAAKLHSAAEKYEQTDKHLGSELDKALQEIDCETGDAPPEAGRETGNQPVPIPVDQVTYHQDNFAAGPDATRDYINQALDQLGITDPAARQRWTDGYLTMALRESSYDPNAVNDWDVNAEPPNSTYSVSDGYGNGCSRGIVQCVPGTFAQYHQPGTSNDIYDPVANIGASMNYVMGHYGVSRDASNLAALVPQADPTAGPQGY
ncbi:type VII secretion target [Mycobacterium celatum]|uniref:Transglycosylase SLT domain-containing protein n=1 Tax=Mycobacterium celatum TaxID=28045 RepID=A0A1X1RIQ9_MYCCE|nr:type VII secretion target [Mycobacterium celatum]ORV06980.1 hypothetical protein AWB95_21580 [Mycobacterium celatum]PIB78207.1 hypothetical protein CQY23_15010 [Mycobacterium celatum]